MHSTGNLDKAKMSIGNLAVFTEFIVIIVVFRDTFRKISGFDLAKAPDGPGECAPARQIPEDLRTFWRRP